MRSSIDEDMERRLENWALWCCSSNRSDPTCVSSLYAFSGAGSRDSQRALPVFNAEAVLTDNAIRAIDGPPEVDKRPLRDALRARYRRMAPTGAVISMLTEAEIAATLGVSHDTYMRHLKRAKDRVREELRRNSTDRSTKIFA